MEIEREERESRDSGKREEQRYFERFRDKRAKESEEIKRNKPIFNRALRRDIFTHGLFSFVDDHGYVNLTIDKIDGKKKPITTFSTRQSARSFMFHVTEKYHL